MKQIVLLVIAVLTLSVLLSGQAQNSQNDKVAQRFARLERDWLAASLNQDETWLEQFFTGKLVFIRSENGAVKSRTRETAEIIDPKLKPEEMKVRISGEITLVSNSATETNANRTYYFLDTFNKRDGKWQVIATHFSREQETKSESAEQTIIQMEREWSTLSIKKDIAGLQRIIADDFSGVESSGRIINKDQAINDIESGGDGIQSKTTKDVKVKVYGDTAVVTGRLLIEGKKEKEDYNLQLLFSDLWVKRGGQWQVVNYQATRIK